MATVFNRIGSWVYENRATLMSWGATAGTIGGSILAARAMTKAQRKINEAAISKAGKALDKAKENGANYEELDAICNSPEVELTLWEKVKAGGPSFIPAFLVEAATIGLIHGSNHENHKEINKAKELLAVGMAGFAAYHESVGAITDRTTEFAAAKRVEQKRQDEANGEPPWDQTQLFRIEGREEILEMTREDVFKAEYLANRKFTLEGGLTLNQFYEMFGLPEIRDAFSYQRDGDCMGWDNYIGDTYYGYHWIDFKHTRVPLADGRMVCEIGFPIKPHPLDEDVADREISDQIWKRGLIDMCCPKPTPELADIRMKR